MAVDSKAQVENLGPVIRNSKEVVPTEFKEETAAGRATKSGKRIQRPLSITKKQSVTSRRFSNPAPQSSLHLADR